MIHLHRFTERSRVVIVLCLLLVGCNGNIRSTDEDPHVVETPGNLEENREFISPPTLGHPIYACSSNVTITDFLKDATLNVFVDGMPAPNPSIVGIDPEVGVSFDVGLTFTEGRVIHVTQTKDGITSGSSNVVTVTDHTEDYPDGLPRPRLFEHPLRQCGHAVLVEDVVPGSKVVVRAEDPVGTGFGGLIEVGSFNASTEWGLNWTGVNPEFVLGARVSAKATLCTDESQRSPYEVTEAAPSPMPAGKVQEPVIEGQTLVKVWGATGPGDPPEHGAIVTVYDGSTQLGKSAIPGGVPHNLGISPAPAGGNLGVTQTLCSEGAPGATVPVEPCSALPAPKIEPPLPGDTTITVTESIPGAEIIVFAGLEEVGHSGGTTINLSRALNNGEVVTVIQRLADCTSDTAYQIEVECYLGADACNGDWPAYRHSGVRAARQVNASDMGNPYKVKTLEEKWNIASPDGGGFTASPVVFNGRVYIGTDRGRLYAYDANTGALMHQYPPSSEPALLSQWPGDPDRCANPSSRGIAASVAIARTREGGPVVVLGAPDQGRPDDTGGKFGDGLGSGRIFILDLDLNLIRKTSEEVARLSGLTSASTGEFHEQIGYSSPLVVGDRVYVGIANHCDNPIQNGRIKSVDINTGAVLPASTFSFAATSGRGGGIWTFISGGLDDGLFATTGNTKRGSNPEPSVNHGLSMIRVDTSGNLEGKLQPVPFNLDRDPDWSAGATLMAASCGNLSLSTMKDGFTYAGNMGPMLTFRWQYPWVAYPFPTNDPNDHGDIRYHRAGAAWKDVYFTMNGSPNILQDGGPGDVFYGYRRLHALNVCAGNANRVRWILNAEPYTLDPPEAATEDELKHYWGLGPPTVTEGIVYVGTNAGWLLAVADPTVWPGQGSVCTLSAAPTPASCISSGHQMVPQPTILWSRDLGTSLQRTEPVIANNSVYVASSSGRLLRIAPE